MKKSLKIGVLVLAAALICMIPATASARGPRLSFSLNIGGFPCFVPPPPPVQVVEQRVYVQPAYPCPPPCYQERTVVREYYYSYPRFAYPQPPLYGYPHCR